MFRVTSSDVGAGTVTTVFVRLYAEVPDKSAATSVCEDLVKLVALFGDTAVKRVERYWKITEYFGVLVEITSYEDPYTAYSQLTESLGSGWEKFGTAVEPFAIWNPRAGASFFHPAVRWAEVAVSVKGHEPI